MEESAEPPECGTEGAVVEPVHEDASGMRPSRLAPLAQEWREVLHVVCDEDAGLGGSELEDVRVVETVQVRVVTQRQYVVPLLAQPPTEDTAGACASRRRRSVTPSGQPG